MYCSYYGIQEKPFSITPDPKYLYLGQTHKEAFAHLIYGIRERGGFIVITGEIGTGKTTLCRALLNHLDSDTLVAFILNPTLSALELLKSINEDFGLRSETSTKKELIDELNRFLLEQRQQGKNTVLIIDEAQNLDMEVLEHIRLLSNLETDTEKLIQIILIGQPEFREMLEQPSLLQLNQRVTVRYHLCPLSAEETGAYIYHRLAVAGAE
ncbi:MAG: ExeA family protein, partial [bacterium]